MSDLFEAADSIIKKMAGAPLKPVFREIDYAYHYGQLLGAILYLEHTHEILDEPALRAAVRQLIKSKQEIIDSVAAQRAQNEEALKL